MACLRPRPKYPRPVAFAAGERAVRAAVAEDAAGLLEGHALRLVADHQHGAGVVPLVADADPAGHSRRRIAPAGRSCRRCW